MGAAIQKVQKIQNELEAQMDQAVGKDGNLISSSHVGIGENHATFPEATSASRTTGRETPVEQVAEEASDGKVDSAGDGEFSTIEINEPPNSLEGKATVPEVKKVARKISKSKVKASVSTNNISDAVSTPVTVTLPLPSTQSAHDVNEGRDKHIKELEAFKLQHNDAIRVLERQHTLNLEQVKNSLAQELRQTKEALQKKDQICSERVEGIIKQKNKDLEDERMRFEERIKLLQSESSKAEGEETPSVSLAVHEAELEEHKHKLHKYEEQVSDLVKQVSVLTGDNRKLNEDLIRCREVVSERERALESSNVKLSELVLQADSLSTKCQDLANEVVEKDKMLKQLQLSSSDDIESKKQTTKLLEQVAEQAKRLHAFETEGQQLAKKQSEMEKTVRKSKQEGKEKEQEIAKLKESREQLVKAIEQTQDALKKSEAEAAGHQKSEVQSRLEEISSQKKALESAWGDNNELKKVTIAFIILFCFRFLS
ncbi:hypothetical protein EON65_26730 [archaeon]|nr:MAG: hypothetical protein EON65_26730 [archaeon]